MSGGVLSCHRMGLSWHKVARTNNINIYTLVLLDCFINLILF